METGNEAEYREKRADNLAEESPTEAEGLTGHECCQLKRGIAYRAGFKAP